MTLSVIIPVFNSGPYLKRCLNSILKQARLPDEIICVDDGSTDNSYCILDEYSEKYEFIKLIKTENHGEVHAKKIAIKNAVGKYISFIDSDDYIDETMYAEMMSYALKYDADIITSGLIRDYGETVVDEAEHISPGLYNEVRLKTQIIEKLIDTTLFFRKNIAFNVVNKIFKRDILISRQERIPDSISVGEDICVSYPCIMDCKSIYITGKSYYHYCIRKDSVMGAKESDKYDSIKGMLNFMKDIYLKSGIDQSISEMQFNYLDTYMRLFWRPQDILYYRSGYLKYYGNIPKDARVVIYGAGGFGESLKKYIEKNTDINVIAWVDKSVDKGDVKRPEDLTKIEFDIILVAVLIADIVKQILLQLNQLRIPKDRIRCIDIGAV